ncbi:MAG: FAD-dependent oxidoreductase [Rhodospirillales bacterium]|jgi:glycine/D-amino acid oxidase-like deaminating enzyme|nr:FAD-dependent oxidoreductase [Rhodospirillales bacterium]
MTLSKVFDAAVIGGGILGCSTALNLALGGMRVAVVERLGLGMGASSVNGGTLAMQTKTVAMIPYHLRSLELWRTAGDWLGSDVGFRAPGSMVTAFTDAEAEMQESRMAARRAAGAPIEFVDLKRARQIEPGLTEKAKLVSHCPVDGYASPPVIAKAYRGALVREGVAVREGTAVTGIDRDGDGFSIRLGGQRLAARRVVLAGGAWLKGMAGWLGVELPVGVLVNLLAITERTRPVMRTVASVANGLLTLKQYENGTVLIGGGWIGRGNLHDGGVEIMTDQLVANVRLARHVIPGLAIARVARGWLGLNCHVPDWKPVIGPLSGLPGAFIIGCCRSGFTGGPLLGRLLAQEMLDGKPEMSLKPFDPARFTEAPSLSAAS